MEIAELDRFPSLGWTTDPTPVMELKGLSEKSSHTWVGCKRDDLGKTMNGGAKVRKLDFLLAESRYSQAESWTSVGAIGSGHLTACAAASALLGKKFYPNFFWEPISEGVLENLGRTLELSEEASFYKSRLSIGLSRPGLFFGQMNRGNAIIPVGATCVPGMLGTVKAGLELAAQVKTGLLPEPKRIYVALGSGGTTAGLAVGLALGGLSTRLMAIAVVERLFTGRAKLDGLISGMIRFLDANGVAKERSIQPVPVTIDRSELGKGYGFATEASLNAVAIAKKEGVQIEPVYTGKAMAALLKDLGAGEDGPILFWNTMRGPIPAAQPGWRNRIPGWIKSRLDTHKNALFLALHAMEKINRRRFFTGFGAGAARGTAGLAFSRFGGYADLPGWRGGVHGIRSEHVQFILLTHESYPQSLLGRKILLNLPF